MFNVLVKVTNINLNKTFDYSFTKTEMLKLLRCCRWGK